jgi:hypothetical protein
LGVLGLAAKQKSAALKYLVYERKGIYTEFPDGVIARNTCKVWKCGAGVGWRRSA